MADALDRWLPKEVDAATAQTPVFDRAGMLARLMDDEDLVSTVAGGFLNDIPRHIHALTGFLDAGDVASAERQAHTIKGASATVGGEVLRAVAFEMEQAARAGDVSAVKARMAELEAQFEALKDAMQIDLSSRRGTPTPRD